MKAVLKNNYKIISTVTLLVILLMLIGYKLVTDFIFTTENKEIPESVENVNISEFIVSENSESKTTEYEIVKQQISNHHQYWNQKLGYGLINSYKVESNQEELEEKLKEMKEDILPFTEGPLFNDISRAIEGVETTLSTQQTGELKVVHRIFHDLDIVLNGYSGDTVFYGITETLSDTE